MLARQDLRLFLLSIEQLFRLRTYCFDKLQTILLDDTYRSEMESNTKYQRQYSSLYQKCINRYAKLLLQRSRHLFVAIPREEFLNLSSESSSSVFYSAMTDNFNNLSTEVKYSILNQESIAHSVLACERWIAIMKKCLEYYDYNSAVAIFAALNSPGFGKFKDNLSDSAVKQLDYMEQLTQTTNQSEYLRDVMMGKCIPLLSLYKGILIHTKEGSTGKYKLDEHELVIAILNSLTDMQKQNRAYLSKKPPKLLQRQTLHRHCLMLLDRLKNYSNKVALEDIRILIENAKTVEDQNKIVDDILYHTSKHLREVAFPKDWQSLSQAQEMLKKIQSKSTNPNQDIQAKYELCVNQIREYSHTVVKTDSTDTKNTKAKLKEILKELRAINSISLKVEHIQRHIQNLESALPSALQPIHFTDIHNVQLKLLKKLQEILIEKDEIDSYREHIVTRTERELIKKAFAKLNIKTYSTYLERRQSVSSSPSPRQSSSDKSLYDSESSHTKYNKKNPLVAMKKHTSWNKDIIDNEQPSKLVIDTRKLQRGSLILTPDFNVVERAHDGEHKIASAAIESAKESVLKNKSQSKPPQTKTAMQTNTKKNALNQATLFATNRRDTRNKLRWSWPLVTANDNQYPDEANPDIIIIKVKASQYRK